MIFFKDKILEYRWFIAIGVIIVLFLAVVIEGYFLCQKGGDTEDILLNCEEKEQEIVPEKYTIDIKGAVKTPGVYEFEEAVTIAAAIEIAGGVKSSGTTSNINLSKKIANEMVLYVYTKKELEQETKPISQEPCICETENITSCLEQNSSTILPSTNVTEEPNKTEAQEPAKEPENQKININKASKEELMKISGIGASKAEKIIEYRKVNGKFTQIEDIMKISGIGSTMFENIKDSITI